MRVIGCRVGSEELFNQNFCNVDYQSTLVWLSYEYIDFSELFVITESNCLQVFKYNRQL